jgi:hypothetical protein
MEQQAAGMKPEDIVSTVTPSSLTGKPPSSSSYTLPARLIIIIIIMLQGPLQTQ